MVCPSGPLETVFPVIATSGTAKTCIAGATLA